jgi:hypothetical protein
LVGNDVLAQVNFGKLNSSPCFLETRIRVLLINCWLIIRNLIEQIEFGNMKERIVQVKHIGFTIKMKSGSKTGNSMN